MAREGGEKRRAGGAIRVPFVRRCLLEFAGGRSDDTFIVNINTLGAYVATDVMPPLGWPVMLRFKVPGSEHELLIDGIVAWTNSHQEHPVHSLPPGFGLAFHELSPEAAGTIETIIADYLSRMSPA
jgi:Tfp pilus assembly protein PilZ